MYKLKPFFYILMLVQVTINDFNGSCTIYRMADYGQKMASLLLVRPLD